MTAALCAVAITLNRPEQLNTIVLPMPDEIEAATGRPRARPDIKVIALRASRPRSSGGYDFAAASSIGAMP